MPPPSDKTMVGAYVDRGLADRFRAWARTTDGGASAAIRRLLLNVVDGQEPPEPLGSAGHRVTVRLKDAERLALLDAARLRQTTPANWLRSLALGHLLKRPQWNGAEVAELRAVFTELRRIGNNVNQIAHAVNEAALVGECPPGQGSAALAAAEAVRVETRRVVAVMTGNFDYWGIPQEDAPKAARGALLRDKQATDAERRKIRLRPRVGPRLVAHAKGPQPPHSGEV